MFCDFMSEEIDKTKRFSTENAYMMFKSNQPIKNQLFDPSKGFNMVKKTFLVKINFNLNFSKIRI
jgi:hypothetical protein